MSNKINPDSVVLEQLDDQWQKMAMLLLWKLAGKQQVRVTAKDMEAMTSAFAPGMPIIFVYGQFDAFAFQLVDEDKAAGLAAYDATLKGTS